MASSERRADVVCGERSGGIRARRVWVCDEVRRARFGNGTVGVSGEGEAAEGLWDVFGVCAESGRTLVGTVVVAGVAVDAFCGRTLAGGVLSYAGLTQHRDSQKPGLRRFSLGGGLFEELPSCGRAISGPCTSCQFFGKVSFLIGLEVRFVLFLLPLSCSSWTSNTPSRSTRVSILVLSVNGSKVVAFPFPWPGVLVPSALCNVAAWSLCCQQKNAAAPSCSLSPGNTARTPFLVRRFNLGRGDEAGEKARERRQGRPLSVMPLHVVAGFLLSERGRSDSGVLGMNGMSSQE